VNPMLRRASEADIPFIMACERRPGYEPFVGRWAEDKHRAMLNDANFIYHIGSCEGVPAGFTILRDLTGDSDSLYLKRIAVHDSGAGHGRAVLAATTDWVFGETRFHRFWLEVVEANERARRMYLGLGWVEEGRVREAFANPDGTRGSYVQMSVLKPEWIDRRGTLG